MAPSPNEPRAILLFDGVCNLCHAAVRFVTERDPAGRFAFAPLQSELGRRLLRQAGLPEDTLDTVVLLQDGRAYLRSDAMLRAMKRLRAPWPLASLALVVPRFLRDGVYDFVARHRYRWFGRKDACPVPTPEQRARFLA
ncbi:MAG TPA: thiol-disulfide oxidoreductase DCC family protein [Myxococcota bacterium]|nr:thiol-disulfide oxidoreductase DCC family protein [Myxococcota bacterium]